MPVDISHLIKEAISRQIDFERQILAKILIKPLHPRFIKLY